MVIVPVQLLKPTSDEIDGTGDSTPVKGNHIIIKPFNRIG
jgi:hypothetical protein